jgi:NAD(P)-dependent dehydrogenase (short-subunit alcohol dehydrogenase family)
MYRRGEHDYIRLLGHQHWRSSMTVKLADRVCVVTGAANGIGRASALCLARAGANLAVLDREADALAAVTHEIEALGRRVLPIVLDCTSETEVSTAFEQIVAAFDQIDVLFNNVGQSAREKASEFWQSEPTTWRSVLEISLMSTMLMTRQVVGGMRERRSGKIINMSSESAFYGDVGLVDYSAAKFGVVGFTRALARELAPFRVNVNAVAPGAIRTRAHDRLPGDVIDRIRDGTPMRYIGEPEDVGNAVVFLASDDSRFITGQTLLIDGGRWLT